MKEEIYVVPEAQIVDFEIIFASDIEFTMDVTGHSGGSGN